MWRPDDPEGNEAGKVLWELVPYTRGYGYDLGCGNSKAFPHFVGVDSCIDEKLFGTKIEPDIRVPTCEKLDKFASASADFIFSSHLLEHIEDYKAALKEWWRVIKPGGYLCLYLPHKDFYPNIGQPGSNPDHKHDFLPEDIVKAMYEVGEWDLVENQERNEDAEYSFFQVYQKGGKGHRKSYLNKPEKTCAVVRYGAYGDLLMASSIFPQLKKQGYHITLYTVPRGYEAVKHDPHIDRVVLQDVDQVPNYALSAFFEYTAKKYDKFVNLCESVEGTFLAMQDRAIGKFPHGARHKLLNFNYVEMTHAIAEVPYEFSQKFYATPEEKEWAKRERAKLGGSYVVMWPLAGSSVHKHWPHMDTIIARLLLACPDIRIVFVGDDACQILESGWANEDRVIKKSGKWTIRQSLSFLEQCDMAIGPETGVMNAAAMLQIPKIVFLSHSSHENLTRDWVNVYPMEPKNTPCWPCHKMIYGFNNCNEGYMEINGEKMRVGALCQVNIHPDQVWDAIAPHLMRKAA